MPNPGTGQGNERQVEARHVASRVQIGARFSIARAGGGHGISRMAVLSDT